MRRSAIAASTVLLLAASPPGARAAQRLIDLRQIAVDTLSDVAVAAFVGGRPIIYYNPALLQRFGSRMTEFFFAHEYGHIHYGHTGGALADEGGELSLTRQRQELAADCYAAELLGTTDRESALAALRFFTRMGPYRYDIYHPTGAQRAAKILACLPAPAPRGDTLVAAVPAPGDRNVTFRVRSPSAAEGEYALEARIWIDDVPVGTVSSLRLPGEVAVQRFAPGAHRYRIAATVYAFDAMLQLTPGGRAAGEGLVTVGEGDVFAVEWSAGAEPALVRQ
jgi:hypothetical protein